MTHLYLIRHAESQEDTQKIIGNLPLTPRGIQQVDALCHRFSKHEQLQPDVVFSSPLIRTQETASRLALLWELPVCVEPGLAKWMPHQAEGLHFDVFKEAYGPNPFHSRQSFPVDETWAQYLLRIYSTLDHLLSHYDGKTMVVVTHRGVIECVYAYLQDMTKLRFPHVHYDCAYTAICYWQKIHDPYSSGWRLVQHNDAHHLQNSEYA
jgi:Fructose-2,6-bisphosphatase